MKLLMMKDVSINEELLPYCSCTFRIFAELVHDTESKFVESRLQPTVDSDI